MESGRRPCLTGCEGAMYLGFSIPSHPGRRLHVFGSAPGQYDDRPSRTRSREGLGRVASGITWAPRTSRAGPAGPADPAAESPAPWAGSQSWAFPPFGRPAGLSRNLMRSEPGARPEGRGPTQIRNAARRPASPPSSPSVHVGGPGLSRRVYAPLAAVSRPSANTIPAPRTPIRSGHRRSTCQGGDTLAKESTVMQYV
jgi:hypothetical protein